ncbi:acetyltransferase [Rhodopseudomonas palustris]|uniref:Acetyltransferase n=1 Tax=Rhodopseudomonas palustris TaxID=1076 RepID=A0AAX3E105_RHOPL|nr:acetyltransferase [Rhodopseudomonas palustris]UYO40495.1 acetyltransferase [Rhodopseudomonas palustris]
MSARIVCIGGGGHAVVVIDTLRTIAGSAGADFEIVGFIDATGTALPVLGVPCIGTDSSLPRLVDSKQLTHFIVAVGSTGGGGDLRARLFAASEAAGLVPFTAIHPSAIVAGSARIGGGSVVIAGAVIQPRAELGRNVIVNTRASIDHDCRIGDHVHVAPGAVLSGGVVVEDGSHVGAGVVILQNLRVGRGATVAAGATVVRDVAPRIVVKGTPAR